VELPWPIALAPQWRRLPRASGVAAPAEDVDAWSEILRDALEYNEHLDPILRGLRIDRARTFDWGQSAALVVDAYRRLSSGGLDTE